MKNYPTKIYVYLFLFISFGVFYLLYLFSDPKPKDILTFTGLIPKVVTADLVVFYSFTKWLWKIKVFRKWLVPFPNINGTWKGKILPRSKSENDSKSKFIDVTLIIHQTFFSISCVMLSKEMTSHSYSSNFIIDPDNQIQRLIYSYLSEPIQAVRDKNTIHNGTAILDIYKTTKSTMTGSYWTDRNTSGQIVLDFYSKGRIHITDI